jgi:hypothetical protein
MRGHSAVSRPRSAATSLKRGRNGELSLGDPLEPQPHDPDVKALLRVAVGLEYPVTAALLARRELSGRRLSDIAAN